MPQSYTEAQRRTRLVNAMGLRARQLLIHHPHDSQRISIPQFLWQCCVREVLVANRTGKAPNRHTSHRGRAVVRGRRKWPAMHHGVVDLNSRGESVEDDTPDFGLEYADQFLRPRQVLVGAMNGRGEMAFELLRRLEQIALRSIVHQQRCRAKHFFAEIRVSEKLVQRNAKYSRLTDRGALIARTALLRNHSRLAFCDPLLDRLRVLCRNAMGQHSERCELADALLQLLLETSALVLRHKHQTRFCAELS